MNRNCSALNKSLTCLLFFQARRQSASLPIQIKQWPDLEEFGGRTQTTHHPQPEECAETWCYSGIVEAELTTLEAFSQKPLHPDLLWIAVAPHDDAWGVFIHETRSGLLARSHFLTLTLEVGDILL